MNQETIIEFLKALSADNIQQSGEWIRCSCVLAPWTHDSGSDAHPSFAIKINAQGKSFFNCYTCESGSLTYLLSNLKASGADLPRYDIKTASQILAGEEVDAISLHVPDYDEKEPHFEPDILYSEMWLSSFLGAWDSPMASSYLHGRGINQKLAKYLDIRFDIPRKAVCFPIRNFSGDLVGLRARRLYPDEDCPRYHIYKTGTDQHNRLPWFGEYWVNFNEPVVMVESVFDLASVLRVTPNVIAPLTSGMSMAKVKRVSEAVDVITLFDRGRGGNKARDKISKYLGGALIKHLRPHEMSDDPGAMDVDELVEVLRGYVPINVDKYD